MAERPVPIFKQYYGSESDMDSDQAHFFAEWREAWKEGQALSVDGQLSYLFCHVYGVLSWPDQERQLELRRLADSYENLEPYFADYCRSWLADCKILEGDFKAALEELPTMRIGAKAGARADTHLSLRLLVGESPTPEELVAMVGPRVTAWGREHLDLIHAWVKAILTSDAEPTMLDRLDQWSQSTHKYPHTAFAGSASIVESGVVLHSFSDLKEATDYAFGLLREAENTVREEKGIPRVGEGWVAETSLYHALRNYFSSTEVVQHARPEWLGRQHLDVFIPSLAVAVEYQGRQHDEPVEFFGGEKAWRAVRRRDAKKRRLCEEHSVRLIEVRAGYSLESVIEDILGSDASEP